MTQHRSILGLAALALAALSASACVGGSITGGDPQGTPGAGSGSGASAGAGSTPGAGNGSGGASVTNPPLGFNCKAGTVDPGPAPMKVLSRSQYLNSVRDLVGAVSGLDTELGMNSNASAFGLVQPDLAQVDLENYRNAAIKVASSVVANATLLNQLAPCDASAVKRDCAKAFVQSFASKAYRAPVSDAADVELHLSKLYDVGAKVSHAHGIEILIQGILQAPRFLYRVEIGTGEKVSTSAIKLSGYEIAARLSYSLWDTAPDAKLAQAAAAGQLATKEGVVAQLGWMLQDDKGKTAVRRFVENWLHLPDLDRSVKDATLYPQWNAGFRTSLTTQARTFIDDVLANQGGKLDTLLTSQTVFVNKDLGSYYGTTGGDTFTPTTGNAGATSGILTLPAFLALMAKPSESSPIYRGKFVREMMLCQLLPAPPANIPKPPDVMPGVSTRERLAQHEVSPACAGCHKLMDPIGFAFENYDSLGKYRTQDGSAPVDASGELISTGEVDAKINGVVELGQKLAQSETVRQCLARQWFRFALARFEQSVDDCSMKGLVDSFEAAGADLNTLPKAIVESDAFQYRHPLDYEASK